jgi:glycosyltransferase involved in cell wall biosynthesis
MNLHYYPASFANQSRMMKELNSIISLGLADEAVVFGLDGPGLQQETYIGERQRIIRLKFKLAKFFHGKVAKIIELVEYFIGGFTTGLKLRPDVVNCHSLNVLPIGIGLKMIGATRHLIYDAHELETERESLEGLAKWLSQRIERILMPYVDHTIVVSQPIAEWYEREYPTARVSVIRNIPNRQQPVAKSNIFRQQFGIPVDEMICIYQGILAEKRGVHALIDTFKGVGDRWHIVFMGFGPAEAAVVAASKVHRNIHFQPAVDPSEIIRYTSSADVGIFFLIHEPGLSYRYCLPNKFFEYVYSGCPVIVSSQLEHLSKLIDEFEVGWSVKSDVDSLRFLLARLDDAGIVNSRQNCNHYARKNAWEDDEKKYLQAFNKI